MRKSLLVAAALAVASPLAAQQAQEHRGFWWGFGLGVGQNMTTTMDGGTLVGGAGYIRLGGTPRQGLLIGFDGMGWSNDDRNRGNAVASVTWYPSRQGVFLKGGVGLASASRTTTQGNTTTHTSVTGLGLTTGLGIDVKLGRNIYFVPAVDFLVQLYEEQNDPVLGNVPGANTLLIGTIGLFWH